MKVFVTYIFLFLLSIDLGFAQFESHFGLLPTLNVNKKLKKDWAVNIKTESRQLFYDSNQFRYSYVHQDISAALAKKVGLNKRVIVGYLQRFNRLDNAQRFFQQFNSISRYYNYTLAHRFGMDQTFSIGRKAEFRFRYRLASEIPLSGLNVDINEYYIKLSNEYVASTSGSVQDFEIRILGFLGYVLKSGNKLELGVDNRIDSFLESTFRNRFWICINYYMSL